MSKEIVNALEMGDNLEAEQIFNSAITSKVGDALETRRKEKAKTFVKSWEDETD